MNPKTASINPEVDISVPENFGENRTMRRIDCQSKNEGERLSAATFHLSETEQMRVWAAKLSLRLRLASRSSGRSTGTLPLV